MKSVRGVRQGGTLSPTLFRLYTEELAVHVRRTDMEIRVGADMFGCLLYADDIAIMSECGEELQRMLDVVSGYGRDFNVKFSSEKSQVLVINGGEDNVERKWKLDGKDICRRNEYKYLGCVLDTRGREKAKNEELFKAQQ